MVELELKEIIEIDSAFYVVNNLVVIVWIPLSIFNAFILR